MPLNLSYKKNLIESVTHCMSWTRSNGSLIDAPETVPSQPPPSAGLSASCAA